MKKKFKVKKRKVIFSKGPVCLVDCEVRMPSGKILSRQILEHNGAVVIIPKAGRDRYILVRQFRFAAGDWLWEFPAGGIEPGEPAREAAARELAEETGFRPKRLKKLFRFFPTPGISGEIMYLFLGENLVPDLREGDEDEEIEKKEFSLVQMERMARNGKIRDAKTILGIFYLSLQEK
ncbi:MAG TPA: NUDIX hydrolase [bacterium]|nr:NUDIX hydrolase [bacterium]